MTSRLDEESKDLSRARRFAASAAPAARAAAAVAAELARIGREMVLILLGLALALARLILRIAATAWRLAVPRLRAALALARALLDFARREITPARALVAVALFAAIALAASQWADLRAVSVATGDYGDVESVAPAPEVDRERAGDAHAWTILPIAVAAVAAITLAALGRPRIGLLLVPLGLAAVAIALLVDAPKGLDEGAAAVAYEGAEARLLEGFWAEIAAGGVLAVCGLLLPRALRPGRSRPRRAERRRSSSPTGSAITIKEGRSPRPG